MLLLGASESSGDTCTSESPGKPGEMSFPGALPSDFDLAGLLLTLISTLGITDMLDTTGLSYIRYTFSV